jgi:hypothetical protein
MTQLPIAPANEPCDTITVVVDEERPQKSVEDSALEQLHSVAMTINAVRHACQHHDAATQESSVRVVQKCLDDLPELPEGWGGRATNEPTPQPDGSYDLALELKAVHERMTQLMEQDDARARQVEALVLAAPRGARLVAEACRAWGLADGSQLAAWRLEARAVRQELSPAAAHETLAKAAMNAATMWTESVPWACLEELGASMDDDEREQALGLWSPEGDGCNLDEEWRWAGKESPEANSREHERLGRASLNAMIEARIVDPDRFVDKIEELLALGMSASQAAAGCLAMMERLPEAAASEAPWARWAETMAERRAESHNPAGWSVAVGFATSRAESLALVEIARAGSQGVDSRLGDKKPASLGAPCGESAPPRRRL